MGKTYNRINLQHRDEKGRIETIASWSRVEAIQPINYWEGYRDALRLCEAGINYPCVPQFDGYIFWKEDHRHNHIEEWWLEDENGTKL